MNIMERKHLLIVCNQLCTNNVTEVKQALESLKHNYLLSKISLLHVQPYIAANCYALPSLVGFLESCKKNTEQSLHFWGEHLNVDKKHQWTSSGNARQEILRFTRCYEADYILGAESMKNQLTHQLLFANKDEASLIRSFDKKLYLFTTEQEKVNYWNEAALAVS
jgi:hypothetical protein